MQPSEREISLLSRACRVLSSVLESLELPKTYRLHLRWTWTGMKIAVQSECFSKILQASAMSSLLTLLFACAVAALIVVGIAGKAKALALYRSEAQAQQHCPRGSVVWLDFRKRKYYLPGQYQYGRGATAIFVCRAEAKRDGYRRSLFGLR